MPITQNYLQIFKKTENFNYLTPFSNPAYATPTHFLTALVYFFSFQFHKRSPKF